MVKKVICNTDVAENAGLGISSGKLHTKTDGNTIAINEYGQLHAPFGGIHHNDNVLVVSRANEVINTDRCSIILNRSEGNLNPEEFPYSVLIHEQNKPLDITLGIGTIHPYKYLTLYCIHPVEVTFNILYRIGNYGNSYMVNYPEALIHPSGNPKGIIFDTAENPFDYLKFDMGLVPNKRLHIQEFEIYSNSDLRFLFC